MPLEIIKYNKREMLKKHFKRETDINIHVFTPVQPNMLEVFQVSTSRHLPLLLQSTTADTVQQQSSPLDGSGITNC